jgi:hypothetical protein
MDVVYLVTRKPLVMNVVYLVTRKPLVMDVVYLVMRKPLAMDVVYLVMRKPLVMDGVYLPGAKMVSEDLSSTILQHTIIVRSGVLLKETHIKLCVYSLIHHRGGKLRGVLIG